MTDLRAQVPAPSAHQLKILALVADGHTSAHIGELLDLSEQTIKTHLRRLFKHTGAAHRAGLVAYAYRAGWLTGATPAAEPAAPEPVQPGADRRRVQRVHVALRQWTDLRNNGSAAATGEGLRRAVTAALELPEVS